MKTLLLSLLYLWVQTPLAPPGPRAAAPDDYRIGPKDVIELKIYGEESMSRPELAVDIDGMIDCPGIGLVKVAGLSARQVEQELTRRLGTTVDAQGRERGILRNPNISITVKQYRSQLVWVSGAVRSPQAVTLRGAMTLQHVLSAEDGAGPLNLDAGSYILILHAPEGQAGSGPTLPGANVRPEDVIKVPRQDYDMGRANSIKLRDGDTVFVPTAERIFVYGEVRQTGPFVLTPDITNVLRALALAGGVTDRGAKNRITIERVVNGTTVEIKVKESDPVLPGDTIKVPRRRV
jgi:polysaccharide biosynthesis/export protein